MAAGGDSRYRARKATDLRVVVKFELLRREKRQWAIDLYKGLNFPLALGCVDCNDAGATSNCYQRT
jgi:hypothetical protein